MKTLLLISSFLIHFIPVFSQPISGFDLSVSKSAQYGWELCQQLHSDPEVSYMETQTAKRLAGELESMGFTVTSGIGGNSVAGIYENGDGPTVMLRTDMDALPIKEQTGLPFASSKTMKNIQGDDVPVMHACGHDIHMSVCMATARSLIELKNTWKGTLMIICQQAEEVGQGADAALKDGLYEKIKTPDYALAFHINPEIVSGKIALQPGPVFAGVQTVEITVFGKGGHGAFPEKCIDPVVIASRIILDLQTIVSREISPLDPAVVTVGSIHGGSAPNIIPDAVKMELTLRFYDIGVLDQILSAIERICNGAASTAGMSPDKYPAIWVDSIQIPPVINETDLAARLSHSAKGLIGDENVITVEPAMVGEDFAKYGSTKHNVPICLTWLGSTGSSRMKQLKQNGKKPAPLHSAELMPDYQNTIETGIRVMVNNVLVLMD